MPDQLITASSYYNFYGAPRNARLHQRRVGRLGGSWYAKRNDKRQWLKIDFGGLTRVSRIATQGRQNADQWVTSYYVSYSVKGFRFVTYKEYRRTKVSKCSGNEYQTSASLSTAVRKSLLFCIIVRVISARISRNSGFFFIHHKGELSFSQKCVW